MNVNNALDSYLNKKGRYTEKQIGNGDKEVCDLETNECYTVRMKDGLIERVDNTKSTNKRVQVETLNGVKQLLNG
jgi:hypothetical protein